MTNHLFINQSSGQPVKAGLADWHPPVKRGFFGLCDSCGEQIYREVRSTKVGLLTRHICPCSCRVSIRLFVDSDRVRAFLDQVGVMYD